LRYEHEGGITERFNRGVAGGFLVDAKLSFSDAAEAAYARSPLTEMPASQFKILGGTEYSDRSRRNSPTAPISCCPGSGGLPDQLQTVLRTGYGWYFDTLNANNTRANQLATAFRPHGREQRQRSHLLLRRRAASGLSSSSNPMVDPSRPRRRLPLRRSLRQQPRLVAFAGRGLTFTPRDFQPAKQQRWRVGIQRQIGGEILLDVSYNGSLARIPVSQRSAFAAAILATGTSATRPSTTISIATSPIRSASITFPPSRPPTPLYSYLRTQAFFTNSTIRKNQLLRAFRR